MEIDIKKKKNLILVAVVLNLLIVVAQIIFGIYGNSTALIVDAVHNLQDVLSLVIALIAAIYMIKKPTAEMTFGYLRSEALAGFVNSAFLIGAVFIIIITSIEKLLFPEPVNSLIVIILGAIAFVINSLSAYFLGFHHHHEHNEEEHHHEDLNIKAAYLHLLSDALISLGVVVGGILMYFFSIYWIDPVLAILFSVYIFKETVPVLKKTFNILMEGVPYDISLPVIKNIILSFPEVIEVHDLHIWSLSSKDFYLTGHIVVSAKDLNEIDKIIKKIEIKLRDEGINHITLQPETKDFKCENVY
jgi:cobalt-zinc-cadmium efflux system protein